MRRRGPSPTLANLEPDSSPSTPDDLGGGDPREELVRVSRILRAHLERFAASGAWGMPPSPRPERVVGSTSSPGPRVATQPSGAVTPRAAPTRSPVAVPPTPPVASAEALPLRTPNEATSVISSPAGARAPADTTRLAVLADEARACTKCVLHSTRRQSVFSRGTGASGLVFVGEGPGEEEDRLGEPFVGPAGQLLDRMIAAMQLGRDDVYVCNIVKCRPPSNRKPDLAEMSECMPYLSEQLSIIRPRVIVALGATAVQGLLGTTEGITRLRGQWKLYRGKVPVMPTFHPAYLLRQPTAKKEVWKDLQEVLRQLSVGV